MKFFDRKNRFKFRLFLVYPLPLFLTVPDIVDSANPLEELQDGAGVIAVFFLLLSLFPSPLRLIFPQTRLFAFLLKYRKEIGVTAFFYSALHVLAYVFLNLPWDALSENLIQPFALTGSASFAVLFLLAVTSLRFFKVRLGGKNWKRLHRLVYLLIPLLFLHLVQNEKGDPLQAVVFFLPIALLELYRLTRFIFKRR